MGKTQPNCVLELEVRKVIRKTCKFSGEEEAAAAAAAQKDDV